MVTVPRGCLPVAARGHLLAHMYEAEHDLLISSGVLGGNAAWLFERAFEEVTLSVLSWPLFTATRQRTWVALVSSAMNRRLIASSLPSP
jgi:hypothetical protein